MSNLQRQMIVCRLLAEAGEGIPLRLLAERLGVSKNTAQRDIDDLCVAGIPVEERQQGHRNLFFLREAAPGLPATGPSAREVAALEGARAAPSPFQRTPLFAGLEQLRADHAGPTVPRVPPESIEGPHPRGLGRLHDGVFDAVLQGLLEHRRCRLAYVRRGERATRDYLAEPCGLLLSGGLVYVRACVPPHRRPALFAAHRIRRATLTSETFRPPPPHARTGFGVFEGAPQNVRARFAPEIAPFIAERRWHPTQRVRWERDGKLLFEARLSGLDEFVGWILSWGGGAELLAPAAWRREAHRRASATARSHR